MYAHYLAEDSAFNFNQVDIPKKSTLELVHKAHTIDLVVLATLHQTHGVLTIACTINC